MEYPRDILDAENLALIVRQGAVPLLQLMKCTQRGRTSKAYEPAVRK